MKRRSVPGIVFLCLLLLSCAPRIHLENHVAHPILSPPLPDRSLIQVGGYIQNQIPQAREGGTNEIHHEGLSFYGQFGWLFVGVQGEITSRLLHPGVFLFHRTGNTGVAVRLLTTMVGETVKRPTYLIEPSVFGGGDRTAVLLGFRVGSVPLYGSFDYSNDDVHIHESFNDEARV